MKKFTVVAYHEDNGQICSYYVRAKRSMDAFTVAAKLDANEFCNPLFIVALPGWVKEMEFPGEKAISKETILEQTKGAE